MPIRTRGSTAPVLFAWTGAGIFAASLLWFLYCYLIRFGQPADPGPVARPVVLDVLLFSAFALHHSWLARAGVKRWMHRYVPRELERSVYTWTASVLFIAVCAFWQPVPGVLYRLDGFSAAVGYLVQGAGVLLTIRGSAAIDVLDLAGVRAVLVAREGSPPRSAALETGGAYSLVRHPLYLGWALIVFGAPVMTATRATFAIVSTTYVAVAIRWEERDLELVFGPAYEDYRRRVRWKMIPWLY